MHIWMLQFHELFLTARFKSMFWREIQIWINLMQPDLKAHLNAMISRITFNRAFKSKFWREIQIWINFLCNLTWRHIWMLWFHELFQRAFESKLCIFIHIAMQSYQCIDFKKDTTISRIFS